MRLDDLLGTTFYVHCKTEEQALKLLKELDKKGYKWSIGKTLTEISYYEQYRNNTIYCIHNGGYVTYADYDFYKSYGNRIYEFDDISFESQRWLDWYWGVPMFLTKDILNDYGKVEVQKRMQLSCPPIKTINVNKPKSLITVVFIDGSIEQVKCDEKDDFDVNIGVSLAIARKMFGSNTKFHKEIENKVCYIKKGKKDEKTICINSDEKSN